jgi:hypothetical protein
MTERDSSAPIVPVHKGSTDSASIPYIEAPAATRPDEAMLLRLELDNAKLRLEAESRQLFEKHEKALRHVKFYKWISGVLFGVILGGSIYSVANVDDYIDNHVAQRVIKLDRVSLMLNKAQFGQWREALGLADEIRVEFDSGKLGDNPEFKRFVYLNELWLLSQSYERTAGGWVGQDQYDQLMKSEDFRRELFVKRSHQDDGDMMLMMGMCVLKFEKLPESLPRGRSYLEQSLSTLRPVQRRAGVHWALAMLDLIEGNRGSARQHLKDAEDLYPSEFLIQDLVPYKNTFIRSEEFDFWTDLAVRVNQTDFAQTYENFIEEVSLTAQPHASTGRSASPSAR